MTSRADGEQLVRTAYPREVAACQGLVEFAWAMIGAQPWQGREFDEARADRLIAAEGARGFKTYRASLDAALGGYGPQSAMLNRSLFEGMVVAHWVRARPKEAVERFQQHERHNRGMWNRRLLERDAMDEPVLHVPDEDEMAVLDGIFGKHGGELWCGLSLYKLVAAVEDQWDEGFKRTELWDYFTIANADSNEALHTGSMALSAGVVADTATDFEIEAGPSLQHVERALFGGLWSYTHLLKLFAYHFELPGCENIEAGFVRSRAAFVRLDPETVSKSGRNEPCPCGSGMKFKHCHAA